MNRYDIRTLSSPQTMRYMVCGFQQCVHSQYGAKQYGQRGGTWLPCSPSALNKLRSSFSVLKLTTVIIFPCHFQLKKPNINISVGIPICQSCMPTIYVYTAAVIKHRQLNFKKLLCSKMSIQHANIWRRMNIY